MIYWNGVDEQGLAGMFFHYAMIFFFMGSALLLLIYFWMRGTLSWDEEAKFTMLDGE